MLRSASLGLRTGSQLVRQQLQRNFGVSAAVAQKQKVVDPIQQLFVDKIREYAKKSTWVVLLFVLSFPFNFLTFLIGLFVLFLRFQRCWR